MIEEIFWGILLGLAAIGMVTSARWIASMIYSWWENLK